MMKCKDIEVYLYLRVCALWLLELGSVTHSCSQYMLTVQVDGVAAEAQGGEAVVVAGGTTMGGVVAGGAADGVAARAGDTEADLGIMAAGGMAEAIARFAACPSAGERTERGVVVQVSP